LYLVELVWKNELKYPYSIEKRTHFLFLLNSVVGRMKKGAEKRQKKE